VSHEGKSMINSKTRAAFFKEKNQPSQIARCKQSLIAVAAVVSLQASAREPAKTADS
jgi:hypothetical protein